MPEPYQIVYTARHIEQLRNILTAALKAPTVGLMEARQIVEADLNICNQVAAQDAPKPPEPQAEPQTAPQTPTTPPSNEAPPPPTTPAG